MPLYLLVEHLVIAHGRLEKRVPINEPLAAADEPLAKQAVEGGADGRGALVVEREPHALPVAARPQVAKLAQDPLLVLLLPGPDPRHQRLAAQVVPGELFLLEKPPLDNGLRGDPRMVGSRHPEREEALHAPGADEQILERVVEGVAEVQGTGDVRRRDHDGEHAAAGRRLGVPGPGCVPQAATAGLGRAVIVLLGQFVHRWSLGEGKM